MRARHALLGVAILAVAFGALALTLRAPVAPAMTNAELPSVIVSAEHAVVADYLRMDAEQRLAADRAADDEWAQSRAQAAAQYAQANSASALRQKPARVAAATAAVPIPVPAPVAAAGEPLPLQASPPPPAFQATPVRRPVITRVVATVERIPTWVQVGVVDAASWVIDLPGKALRLPERHFL